MAVVVDAHLLVVLALDRAKAGAVEERLRAWRAAGESLHAASLLRDEIATALTRAVDAGQLAESDVELTWRATTAAPIRLHELAQPAETGARGRCDETAVHRRRVHERAGHAGEDEVVVGCPTRPLAEPGQSGCDVRRHGDDAHLPALGPA